MPHRDRDTTIEASICAGCQSVALGAEDEREARVVLPDELVEGDRALAQRHAGDDEAGVAQQVDPLRPGADPILVHGTWKTVPIDTRMLRR